MEKPRPSLCLRCRGSALLCGKAYCPVLARSRAYRLVAPLGEELAGSTPPSVFVGRHGYPRVRLAPLVPPLRGDTSIYDSPERWVGMRLDEILSMRLSLVRAYTYVNVKRGGGRLVEELRELALSSRPVDVEARLRGRPRGVALDEHVPPLGPASPLERLEVAGNPRVERPVEKAYGDTDLGAAEAVVMLYESGVPVSRISRIFSVGALGVKGRRRLVPTRWSITAVDDVVSRHLIGKVKGMGELGEYLVYIHRAPRNVFAAILLPGRWRYEWIEAWYPHTVWNPGGELEVEGDWEGYRGRTRYASLGGCYYAARLATAEHLLRLRRQAGAVLVREVYEGFYDPIGVWFVREHVRAMFRERPFRAASLEEAVSLVARHTRLPAERWVAASRLLRDELKQRSILEWVARVG